VCMYVCVYVSRSASTHLTHIHQLLYTRMMYIVIHVFDVYVRVIRVYMYV